MINGMINIYKEAGFTSHDVVAKMRGILKQKKIGHTGTLDPEAVGVLPVCLGNGTKLCDMFTDKSKVYEGVLYLGVATDTQDMTGKILERREIHASEEEIREVVLSFLGEYHQIPPMYSALKVNGQKLYELARQGKEVERKPRELMIESIEILSVDLPRVRFLVGCSKGTYIRTLCHDIGEKLGCGAAMESLIRRRVGNFRIEDAITLSMLETLRDENRVMEKVISVESLFNNYTGVKSAEEYDYLLKNGNSLLERQMDTAFHQNIECLGEKKVRMYDSSGVFYGIYEYIPDKALFKPFKMFLPHQD